MSTQNKCRDVLRSANRQEVRALSFNATRSGFLPISDIMSSKRRRVHQRITPARVGVSCLNLVDVPNQPGGFLITRFPHGIRRRVQSLNAGRRFWNIGKCFTFSVAGS